MSTSEAPRIELHGPAPTRCPYCHDDVDVASHDWIACADCLARHHRECWSEIGRCSACQGTLPLDPAARASEGATGGVHVSSRDRSPRVPTAVERALERVRGMPGDERAPNAAPEPRHDAVPPSHVAPPVRDVAPGLPSALDRAIERIEGRPRADWTVPSAPQERDADPLLAFVNGFVGVAAILFLLLCVGAILFAAFR